MIYHFAATIYHLVGDSCVEAATRLEYSSPAVDFTAAQRLI